MPRSTAQPATSAREPKPSLRKMFVTCDSTVRTVMTNSSAMARLLIPLAIRAATSRWRGVRPPHVRFSGCGGRRVHAWAAGPSGSTPGWWPATS